MKKLLIITLLIVLSACNKTTSNTLKIGDTNIKIEIADTPEERKIGLQNRQTLDQDAGMLFIFEKIGKYNFWMKSTFIPLEMIFMNEKGEIHTILNATPCEVDPCELYKPNADTKAVLEVNTNFSENHDLKIGDIIDIKKFLP